MIIQQAMRQFGLSRYHRWLQARGQDLLPPNFYRLRQQMIRIAFIISILAIGIFGVFVNTLYTLRLSLGSSVILLLLRFRYVLLLAWVLFPVVVRANPLLAGSNVLTGLTAPTLLLMTVMPLKETFKRLPPLALLLIFILWMLPGIFTSPLGFSAALTNWVIYLNYVAVGVLAINVLTTQRRIQLIINAMLLSGTFVALFGIYGYIIKQNGIVDPQVGFRIYAIFASSPSLALFLSLVTPLGFYCVLTSSGLKRLTYSLSIPILLTALVLTFTRGALISLPLSIGVIILLQPSRKMRIGLLWGTFGLFAFGALATIVGNIPIFNRFSSEDVATLNGRTDIWQALLSNFDPTQLFGKGMLAADTLLSNTAVGKIATAPHNLFLGALYDQGIIGATILLLVFIVLFVNLIMGMLKASGERRVLFAVALAVFVNVFVLSIDNSDLWIEDFSIYFWVIVALPFALYWSMPDQSSITNREALNGHEATRPLVQTRQSTEQEQVARI
jgi:O-antigen ligase